MQAVACRNAWVSGRVRRRIADVLHKAKDLARQRTVSQVEELPPALVGEPRAPGVGHPKLPRTQPGGMQVLAIRRQTLAEKSPLHVFTGNTPGMKPRIGPPKGSGSTSRPLWADIDEKWVPLRSVQRRFGDGAACGRGVWVGPSRGRGRRSPATRSKPPRNPNLAGGLP